MKTQSVVYTIVLLILNLFLSLLVFANEINKAGSTIVSEPIKIAAFQSPFLLSDKSEYVGIYNDLMSDIKRHISIDFEIIYMPPMRAEQDFTHKNVDCILPVNLQAMPNKDVLISTSAFNIAKAYIYTRIDEPAIQSLTQLRGMVVAKRKGYSYGGGIINDTIKVVGVSNIEQSINMLMHNRIDAFIAYEPDITGILKRLPAQVVHRDNEYFVHKQEESIVCNRNELTEQFVVEVNQRIKQLIASGQLTLLLSQKPFLKPPLTDATTE